MKEHTLGEVLRAALSAAKVQRMTWYSATRHSYASRFVQNGGSLLKLAAILGHSTAEVTLRYAHLMPDVLYRRGTALVDLPLAPEAAVLPLASGT